jgi:hypothetical protein
VATETTAQLLELENDLIGSFYEAKRSVPEYQFRKERQATPGEE